MAANLDTLDVIELAEEGKRVADLGGDRALADALIEAAALHPAAGLGLFSSGHGDRLLQRLLRRDTVEEDLEHWIEYPKSGARVPRAERELLRAFVLDRNAPLQLRAEGALRRLGNDPDPEAMSETLREFAAEIGSAAQALADNDEVQAGLKLVAQHGARRLLGLDPADPAAAIGFTAENGSLAALLRAVQPTLNLDRVGMLPLSSHGSTTTAILAAAEASAAAQASGQIVLADDFGDQLDAASGEYLAARLRRRSGQLAMLAELPNTPAVVFATERASLVTPLWPEVVISAVLSPVRSVAQRADDGSRSIDTRCHPV